MSASATFASGSSASGPAASPPGWELFPERFHLPEGELHVVRSWSDARGESLARFERWLSARELERASRFRFFGDRACYVASRGALRQLLGIYLQVEPGRVALAEARRGKPFLEDPSRADIRFNLSHSGGLTLYAFCRGREVGVDVERMTPGVAEEGLERFFTREEARRITASCGPARGEAFFRCWTAKEAILKAAGEGLFERLDSFAVTDAEDQEVLLDAAFPGPRSWRLLRMRPAAFYAAAVAAEKGPWRARLFEHRT